MTRSQTPSVPGAGHDVGSDGEATAPPGVSAVVVNHDAGRALLECVASLRAEGVAEVTVVDNASTDGSPAALESVDDEVRVVRTGANLGYGAGANRGIATATAELVLVSNPDVAVHPGALVALARVLAADPTLAVVGPRILEADGSRYPSARRFPSLVDAVGHALLAGVAPTNRFSRRYRMADLDPDAPTEVDWVSGACFLARRRALDELGGFDEAYFMYAEDADLCWRARQAGWGVAYVPDAVVTHLQGISTARRPYRMLLAHHRSVLRFASRTTKGWRRATLPAMAVLLAVRLAVACARQALAARRGAPRPAE
ncbi:MAG TPA: glycosyltransferase family 2 protein [Acidimicrobiales bacterium]|nr:glycosyltransferase family 2 protein [Acidimicrobiales bacterium]